MSDVQPRGADGRFVDAPKGEPEVALAPAPDGARIHLAEGESVTFRLGKAHPRSHGAWRGDDQLTLTRSGDRVRSVYAVHDTLDDADRIEDAATLERVNRHLQGISSGRVSASASADGHLQTRHEDEHPLAEDGATSAGDVLDALEHRFSFLYLRDGYYQATVQACLPEQAPARA